MDVHCCAGWREALKPAQNINKNDTKGSGLMA